MADSSLKKKTAALVLVGSLVAAAVVALTMFSGGFTSSESVTVTAPRSGLVMDPDAKVKLRGVQVGKVASIEEDDGQARLDLAMDPSTMHLIPSNAKVEIKSTTVFGAKYVNFVVPENPSSQSLSAGTNIEADSVTVEFNTLFQNLSTLLQQIEPEKLNATLGAISSALNGRGEQLGELLEETDQYLKTMNPVLPQLQQDLDKAAKVTNLYADVTPDLMHLLDNATATSGTIVEEQANLDLLLMNVTGLANTATDVLTENEANLTKALADLRPTTALLSEYSPSIACLISGMNKVLPDAEKAVGGLQPGFALSTNFLPGAKPYTYPKDLPKVNASGGPNCWGLPDFHPKKDGHAKFVVADTGNVPYQPSTETGTNVPKLFQWLYAGVPVGGQK
ncbi:MCE family protein [Rhodococcus tukisamuensis]|uniref:Phospholipid/cholesterol/gamma-HCH transport system substrate-binding protein n=1 Tax=Rhodococcus tukisamuensis TaxID=168276 RepID=A0A1G6NMQ6_9NOCA|nr:MCE family protein [Rhodococcus tukisamuensis]SDC69018.1 phospholipid/cholesterol/gamma-HCH transport system substrate-binding protein [Rhodococcus tukisamuensis]